MSNVEINLTPKQSECFRVLNDNESVEIVWGAGAGPGKSFTGTLWCTTMAQQYPGTRWLIARTSLTALKLSTLKTLLDLFKLMGLEADKHYKFNQQDNVITFTNGSELILKDAEYRPSDPDVSALGSTEYSGIFVDEAQMLNSKVYEVLKTRIRYKLDEYQILGRILLTCNPQSTGYLKRLFWQPAQDGTLPSYRKFITASAYDNPHLPKQYLDTLERLPEAQRQRLLLGNWNFSSEIDALFDYDSITESFHKFNPNPTDKYVMSLDIAGPGKDKTVMVIAKGNVIVEINEYQKKDINQLAEIIRERMIWYKLTPSQVICDADGIGRGITELLRLKQFVNNSTPLNKENFVNLKSQCYFTLADKFKNGEISINIDKPEMMDIIVEELLTVKIRDVEKDGKQAVIGKDKMKLSLGRSTDYADAIMFLQYFNLQHKKAQGKYSLAFIK